MIVNLKFSLFVFVTASCITKICAEMKVMCYFTSWAWYRSDIGKFLPQNINASLCTHVLYAFAALDKTTLTITTADSWADTDNSFYSQITAFKDQGVYPVLSLGGWNESEGDKYSRLVNNATARKNFINHSIKYLLKYNFTGLELDWEYPKCWQGNCTAGPKSDKRNFGVFCKELSASYKKYNLTVSAAVSAGKTKIDEGYDVPVLSAALDWINVMTYDYHSSADGVTGANAPIFDFKGYAVAQSMLYWEYKGAKRSKLNVGVPFYAQTFTLKHKSNNCIGAPTKGPGTAGPYTKNPGTVAYYEVCLRVKNEGWYSESTWTDGTYAFKDNQWMSYLDVGDLEDTAWLVKKRKYGGTFFWALDYDDFTNSCGCGYYPLLTTLNRELGRINNPRVQCY
uniref:GH18 domain-containing protein n=1 Tax=Clastoptera arizonana TaxID=38151 RepID=A0A1B6DWP2_9HEMI